MKSVNNNFCELIGGTPLVRLKHIENSHAIDANLFAKLEYFNPAGSAKDRVALYMIDRAEKEGLLKPGGRIVEPTSGNTGIGLAAVAASRGYSVTLAMPETMSRERMQILIAYGAKLALVKGGMGDAIKKATEIATETGAFMPSQFTNTANVAAHEHTTGPEIWEATNGNIDLFVACVGTGGTVTGVGRYLKSKNPLVRIVAVEPYDSAVLSGNPPGAHKIQGTGAGFIPEILDTKIYDEIFKIKTEQAKGMCANLARNEGYLVGISSGAALYATLEILKRDEFKGKTGVAFLPDGGERYLSTGLFD